jgi:hypothetical protein
VSLIVAGRTRGFDAYLLVDPAGDRVWVYDRSAGAVNEVQTPSRLIGRGAWTSFDGDEELVLREARAIERGLP